MQIDQYEKGNSNEKRSEGPFHFGLSGRRDQAELAKVLVFSGWNTCLAVRVAESLGLDNQSVVLLRIHMPAVRHSHQVYDFLHLVNHVDDPVVTDPQSVLPL